MKEPNMEDVEELLPCPFCGNEADVLTQGRSFWGIECLGCGVFLPPESWYTSRKNAVNAWNARFHRTKAVMSPAEIEAVIRPLRNLGEMTEKIAQAIHNAQKEKIGE